METAPTIVKKCLLDTSGCKKRGFYEMSATIEADYENYKYKPFQYEEREEEDDFFVKEFNKKTARDIWRVRVIKDNTILLIDEMPSEDFCEYWITDLKNQNYDFDDYDILQGTLCEDGSRWW